jgi:uncharacterized protein
VIGSLLLLLTGPVIHAQNDYPQPSDLYVNDFAGLLTTQDAANVKNLFVDLKNDTGIEAVVVTVNSIQDYETGAATFEAFATNLFNTWGIGDKTKNNGVLLLVAVKDRKVRIEVGSGYESSENEAMQEIINEHIIPSFRNDNYSQGIYRGARAIVGKLTGVWPEDLNSSPAPSPARTVAPAPALATVSRPGFEIPPLGLAGGVVGAGLATTFGLRYYLRHRKRRCPDCQTLMVRLDEVADDVYLDSGQKAEELINSIDYDIWKCPACNTHTLSGYTNWLAWFKRCPQCSYRTVKVTSETLEHPTYDSTGRKQVTRDCRHCNYHSSEIVILPMRTRPSDSSSSYSSSSSGGSSFGGGSSSGGGASGSW